ncbi:unnamed protein product [Peronospora destructor]|uniref:EF-hand domain-containing protein n=1 Tax=Peronospora destructor TaxID=86335 RepID=A0AAV0UQF1_9STRA|nr:unnamed protein product [Peronospora destructor]
MGEGSVFKVGEDVEVYQVVVVLNVLAVCLLLFEAGLHHLEHYLAAHNEKYQLMLKKVYRELMILGLLSFIIKMLTEVGGIDGHKGTMLAFQVADLIIFILALALVYQAIIVLLLLRRHNKRVDLAELITTQDLVNVLDASENATSTSGSKEPNADLIKTNVVEHRILRHLFLRRFGLPQLFPFSKYLRRAQANNIVHTIEVEPSIWVLVLGMSWALSAVVQILKTFEADVHYELVETLMAFAWMLVLFNILVLLYFRFCKHRLLKIGGYSSKKPLLIVTLNNIAEDEASAWQNEAADSALDAMNRIYAQHEELEHVREAAKGGILKGDAGFELLTTCFRTVMHILSSKKRPAPLPSGVLSESPEIHLPLFSRNAWHVAIMFMTILNAFFVALLAQGAVYSFDDIHEKFGILPVILIPLPLAVNAFFLQKGIFRDFVLISSIVRIDVTVLGEVVSHFSEIVELRSEFANVLIQCLKESGCSIAELDKVLQSHDLGHTGFIDINKLRTVLASFGFLTRLTRFKFNSVVSLLLELQGTSVEYAQLIQLVTLVQQEHCIENGFQKPMASVEDQNGMRLSRFNSFASTRHLPLLTQSHVGPEADSSDNGSASDPSLRRLPTTGSSIDGNVVRRTPLERGYSSLLSSARVLHGVYNLRRATVIAADSTSNNAN